MTEPAPPLTLAESARRYGQTCWLERRLYEVAGSWAAGTVEPAWRPLLAAHAAHHAWHAEVLETRLPRASGFDVDGLVAPPTEAFAAFVDDIAATPAERPVERLVGLYRVLVPHVMASHADHRDRLTRLTDGPGRRWLRLILSDERHDLDDAERFLGALLDATGGADLANRHRTDLDRRKMRALSNPDPPR